MTNNDACVEPMKRCVGKTLDMRWIPVEERLPEDRELVLASTKIGSVFEVRFFDDHSECQWYAYDDEGFVCNNVVTAWMPLPEPYKGEREDEK